MESFCFSHYPMTTRRKGKRQLSPRESKEQETTALIDECDALAPLAKRHKSKHDNEEPPPSTPPRPKRDFDHAFASTTTATTTSAMTPPPAQQARMVSSSSSSQSAGQVTTESPDRNYNNMPGMNSLLGQLHAERKQRQQHPCPLTQGMHAMSIQTPQRARLCIQLHTDSKLA